MRLIFAGTPDFARAALERLHAAGFEIALVLTQPDRPAGRGMKLHPSAVKQFAQAHGIPVAQPRSLRLDGKFPDDAAQARQALQDARADAMVVAAYGLLLPQWVLDLPRRGCLNIHASLLPRWRGAAPIHRAIEAGDPQTGITIMQMDAGLDTGDTLLVERLAIEAADTTGSLHDRLAPLGARLIVEALELAACGGLRPVPQPRDGVTYAHKIEKAEGRVDWTLPASAIERRMRAFDPFPGAHSDLAGETLKLWRGQVLPATIGAEPGTIVQAGPAGIDVATGDGTLRLLEAQRPGGKRLAVADLLHGMAVLPGQRFATGEG